MLIDNGLCGAARVSTMLISAWKFNSGNLVAAKETTGAGHVSSISDTIKDIRYVARKRVVW